MSHRFHILLAVAALSAVAGCDEAVYLDSLPDPKQQAATHAHYDADHGYMLDGLVIARGDSTRLLLYTVAAGMLEGHPHGCTDSEQDGIVSSDDSVVVVRADGLDSIVTLNGFTALAKSFTVTGLRPGSATLTASCRDARRQIGVDIVDN